MAKHRSASNGNGNKLDEALRSLVQAQAILVQSQATTQSQIADAQREMAEYRREAAQRFARIEAILLEHSRILQALPDAVREKIGFKPS